MSQISYAQLNQLQANYMTINAETRLTENQIELPQATSAVANYVPFVLSGNILYISGQITIWNGELRYRGKLGKSVSVGEGYQAARLCGLNLLAQVKSACGGDLNRVTRVIKLGGFVNCTSDFTDHPKIINGASDLMTDVFGDAGRHARFAVGASSLPLGVAVEIEGTFEIT